MIIADAFSISILALVTIHMNVLAVEEEWCSEVLFGLRHAGDNRVELETALRKVNGKDTEHLIAQASQYDLVNLTSQQIIENVTYARKVHEALPYLGEKLDEELWRDWVLPHRVLDEDLCLWRKNLYDQMRPLVRDKKNVPEVVEVIHAWLMEGGKAGAARICFGNSENRCKSPSQMLKIGKGACGELSMMFVYLLRAVGVPARHCLMNWKYDSNDKHYYCEYWDPQLQQWIPLDASDEKPLPPPTTAQERSKTQGLGTLTFYAHPGFPEMRDSYHIACLDKCLPVTANMFDTHEVEFGSASGFAGTATAYVWNFGAWRTVARGAAGDSAGRRMELADARPSVNRPVLFTATDGKSLVWALQRPSAKAGRVEWKKAVPGECLRWADYENP